VAVVQDGVAAAAVEGEVLGAALLPLEGLLADSCGARRAVVPGLGVGGAGLAGWLPAVVFNPVGDRVPGLRRLVVGVSQPPSDLGDDLLALAGVAGGEAAPLG
jgi:hypothetical protein